MMKWRILSSGILVFSLICIGLSALTTTATPQRRSGVVRVQRHAAVVVTLPRDRMRVLVGRQEYFYSRGVFYRTGPRGYITVPAPIGARIRVLPGGYTTVTIAGGPLFCYYGTYYRYDPADRSYIVVNPPAAGKEPVQTQDMLEMVDGTTLAGTFMGGNGNTIQFQTPDSLREIPIDQIISIKFAPPSPN